MPNIPAHGDFPKQAFGFLALGAGISKDNLCQVSEHRKITLSESGILLELGSPPSVFLTHRSDIGEQSQMAPSVLDHNDIYQPVGNSWRWWERAGRASVSCHLLK